MTLATHERPKPTASRIKGTRAVLKSVILLKQRASRAMTQRAQTAEERLVLGCLVARLEASMAELAVLPVPFDPRESRTVRKSTRRDLRGIVPADRWQVGQYET